MKYVCCILPCLFLSIKFDFDTIHNILEHVEDSCFRLFSLLLLSIDIFVDLAKFKGDCLHETLIVFFSFCFFGFNSSFDLRQIRLERRIQIIDHLITRQLFFSNLILQEAVLIFKTSCHFSFIVLSSFSLTVYRL